MAKQTIKALPGSDWGVTEIVHDGEVVGRITVEVINDNVVVEVVRIDEAWFGPASVVVR